MTKTITGDTAKMLSSMFDFDFLTRQTGGTPFSRKAFLVGGYKVQFSLRESKTPSILYQIKPANGQPVIALTNACEIYGGLTLDDKGHFINDFRVVLNLGKDNEAIYRISELAEKEPELADLAHAYFMEIYTMLNDDEELQEAIQVAIVAHIVKVEELAAAITDTADKFKNLLHSRTTVN